MNPKLLSDNTWVYKADKSSLRLVQIKKTSPELYIDFIEIMSLYLHYTIQKKFSYRIPFGVQHSLEHFFSEFL